MEGASWGPNVLIKHNLRLEKKQNNFLSLHENKEINLSPLFFKEQAVNYLLLTTVGMLLFMFIPKSFPLMRWRMTPVWVRRKLLPLWRESRRSSGYENRGLNFRVQSWSPWEKEVFQGSGQGVTASECLYRTKQLEIPWLLLLAPVFCTVSVRAHHTHNENAQLFVPFSV